MHERLRNRVSARSAAFLLKIDGGLDRILKLWLFAACFVAVVRMAFAPAGHPISGFANFAAYFLLIAGPVVSALLALRWCEGWVASGPTSIRLARLGRWRTIDRREAEAHPLYGAGGIMVSLLIGMLLNVPVRAAEFVTSMPPLPANSPAWLSALHILMTCDVVLFTSLYMVAFVTALRGAPIFPRLLAAIWIGDIAMQLTIAQIVGSIGAVPRPVAEALLLLLDGNVKKVLISVALWLPYLLMSERVNVTYRHRIAV